MKLLQRLYYDQITTKSLILLHFISWLEYMLNRIYLGFNLFSYGLVCRMPQLLPCGQVFSGDGCSFSLICRRDSKYEPFFQFASLNLGSSN